MALGAEFVDLWRLSGRARGRGRPDAWRRRLAFMAGALRLRRPLHAFLHPPPGSALARAVAVRPELLGAVVSPCVCAHWDAPTRLAHLQQHFAAVERRALFDFALDGARELLDLGDLQPGLRVVLDQPRWFTREGPLVLNLFDGEARIYSLCFSFGGDAEAPDVYIGAIQGGNRDGLLDAYRDLTKALHGLRPRDLLIELLRMLCRGAGVRRLHAVADANRQHRAAYFGDAKAATLGLDYDAIWTERGGVAGEDGFFELPLQAPPRPLEDVPSKKRATYRRRQEMLQALQARIDALAGEGSA